MIGAYEAPPLFISDVTIATGDYNGDGRAELSTKTNTGPQTGRWRIEFGTNARDFTPRSWSSSTDFIYGNAKSRAVPADYDGDGKTDLAVCTNSGDWRITYSSNSVTQTFKTGKNAIEIPVPGDYDGNGCADIAYYYNRNWYFSPSPGKSISRTSAEVSITVWKIIASGFGTLASHPAQADFDGDGVTDVSVKTDGTGIKNGVWTIRYSSSGNIKAFTLLTKRKNDIDLARGVCAAADYNGDGKADLCVKTDSGKWYVLFSPTISLADSTPWTLIAVEHGRGAEFIPIPANYETGDKKADIAIFSLKDGVFHIDFSSNQYGSWDFATDEGKGGDDFNTDSLYQQDVDNLNKVREAGFNLIVGDTYYKESRQKDYYLALMHRTNLNLIFADRKISNQHFDDIYGSTFLSHINSLNSLYSEHIYAVDLGDEPTGCKANQIKDWVKFFNISRLNFKKIPVFYNLLPTYANDTFFSTECGKPGSYSEYLNAFVSSDLNNSSPFVSFDHYPFGEGGLWRSDYFKNLSLVKSKANLTGNKPFWATIGVNYLLLKRKLNYAELKFSVFAPIAYGAKGILYFTYNNFINQDTIIYGNVKKANRYIRDIVAPVVMNLENTATLHKNNTSLNGTNYFSAQEKVFLSFKKDKSLLRDFSANDILVGIFGKPTLESKGKSLGEYYLWVVNKNTSTSGTLSNITLTLNGNYFNRVTIAPSCDSYDANSKIVYTPIKNLYEALTNTTSITISQIKAGDGLMVRIR